MYWKVGLEKLRMLTMLFEGYHDPKNKLSFLMYSCTEHLLSLTHTVILSLHTHLQYTLYTLVFDVAVPDRAVPSRSSSASIIQRTF